MGAARREPLRPRPAGETLQFMQRLWDLVHALDVTSKRMARSHGVTGPQRLVVRIVGQAPDVTASEIARILGIHPSTLTGILSRLETRALIRRTIDRDDRRRARFRLTAAGERVNGRHRGTAEAAVRRALGRASPTEIEHAARVITWLVEELSRE
jgi:DNA-binding MarR family transcriptional regulator